MPVLLELERRVFAQRDVVAHFCHNRLALSAVEDVLGHQALFQRLMRQLLLSQHLSELTHKLWLRQTWLTLESHRYGSTTKTRSFLNENIGSSLDPIS